MTDTPAPPAPPISTTEALDADSPSLEVLRLRYIHRVIAHQNGNKTRAAETLGIDRRTLNRILARQRQRAKAALKT